MSISPNICNAPITGLTLDDLDNRLLLGRELCPVCESKFTVPVRYIFYRELKKRVLLRACLHCQSFWNIPDTDLIPASSARATSLNWYLSVHARNEGYAKDLFTTLEKRISFTSILEIGCGIGSALSVANAKGKRITGFDLNKEAVAYGRSTLQLDLRDEEWNHQRVAEKYDLVLCISTLEHFTAPLTMIRELALYCIRHKSFLYISVPFIAKNSWHNLFAPEAQIPNNPFWHCEWHYIHFSMQGLNEALSRYGVKGQYIAPIGAGWGGMLFDFRQSGMSVSIFRELERLKGTDVFFWGCGEIYQAKKHLFSQLRPRCILDDVADRKKEVKVDGLDVRHPDEMLDGKEILPIIVFAQDINKIYRTIYTCYPQYTDIIFCNTL